MISQRFLAVAVTTGLALATAAHAQAPTMDKLHDALRLTPAQEGAWRTFQDANRDAALQAQHQSASQLMPTLNAPRRVDLSIALMQSDLAAMQRRGAALKTFYATL